MLWLTNLRHWYSDNRPKWVVSFDCLEYYDRSTDVCEVRSTSKAGALRAAAACLNHRWSPTRFTVVGERVYSRGLDDAEATPYLDVQTVWCPRWQYREEINESRDTKGKQ